MLLNLTAQQITGIVLDKDTKIEIYGAYISSTNNSFSTKTDRKGQFTLPNAAVYFFSKEGYITQRVNITKKKSTIQLIAISESLSEIIIVSNNFKNKILEIQINLITIL